MRAQTETRNLDNYESKKDVNSSSYSNYFQNRVSQLRRRRISKSRNQSLKTGTTVMNNKRDKEFDLQEIMKKNSCYYEKTYLMMICDKLSRN
jgi:hypothetical protein